MSATFFLPQNPFNANLALLQQIKYNELVLQQQKHELALQQRNQALQGYLQNLALLRQREENYCLYLKAQQHHSNLLKEQYSYHENYQQTPPSVMKTEEETDSFVSVSPVILEQEKPKPKPKKETMEENIFQMVNFFVYEFGKTGAQNLAEQRAKYAHSEVLTELFDILTKKYDSSSKCREDMIRFILRKALGSMRDNIRDKKIVSAKAASMELCQKYFKDKFEELMENNINIEDEDAVLSFLLPYKKKSRNKTANACFITEIFASELFYQDYLGFLESFDKILEDDNQKKIQRFTKFLAECVKEKRLNKVTAYKRLPWLRTWLYSSKIIANELLSSKPRLNNSTKLKYQIEKKQKI